MATPVELERLVVRLVGESSSYEKMMNNAIIKGQYVTDRLAEIGRKVESALETLKDVGAKAVKGLEAPIDKFNRRMANMGALLRTGAVNYKQYGLAVQKIQRDLTREQEREFKEKTKWMDMTARGQKQVQAEQKRDRESYTRFWLKEVKRQEREEERAAKRAKQIQDWLSQARENRISKEAKRKQQIMDQFTDASERRIKREQAAHDRSIAHLERVRSKYYRQQEREMEKAEKFREKQLNKAIRMEQQAAKAAYNAWNKGANNTARLSMMGGRGMTAGATAPIVGGAVAGTKFFMDFQDAMIGSMAIMDDVTPRMEKRMKDLALTQSEDSRNSAEALAGAYYHLASAGMSAEQSLGAMAKVDRFAIAARMDMQKATDLLIGSQTALGMRSADTAKNIENLTAVSDALIKMDKLGAASTEQFAQAVTNKAGNAARYLGKDIKELGSLLAVLAQQNVKGAAAGERVTIVWRDLEKVARRNGDALKHYNIKIYEELTGKMRNTADIIRDLENAFAGMSDQQRSAALSALGFQDRSIHAIKSFLGLSDAIDTARAGFESIKGLTDAQAARQLKSFAAQWEMVWHSIQRVGIEIGERLLPYMQKGVDHIKTWVKWWKDLDDTEKGVVLRNAALVAAIGPMLMGISKLITAVVAARQAWVAFEAVMGAANARMLATKAGAYGLAIVIGTVLVKALYDALAGTADFNKEQERGNLLLEKRLELEGKRQAKAEQMTPGTNEFDNQLKMEEKILLEREAAIKQAEAARQKMLKQKGLKEAGAGWAEYFGHKELTMSKNAIGEARRLYEQQFQTVESLREKAANAKHSKQGVPNASGEFSDEEVPDFKGDAAGASRQEKKLNRMGEALMTKAEALGLTSRELEVYKMAMMGAGKEELAAAKIAARASDHWDKEAKLMKERADAAEKALSPFEKFRLEEAKLNELWDRGMVSVDGYRHKIMELRGELARELDLNFNVKGMEGMEAGSAAARAAVEGFRSRKVLVDSAIARAGMSPGLAAEFREGSTVKGFGRGGDKPTGKTLEELLAEIAENTKPEKTRGGKRPIPVEIGFANLEDG